MAVAILGKDGEIITSGRSGSSRRLDVSSRQDSRTFYVSRDTGRAFAFTGLYVVGANDTILLIKNTSPTRDFVITDIEVVHDAATRVRIHLPTIEVSSPTGTTITGVNLNTGATHAAEAIAIQDETTNSLGSILEDTLIAANEPHTFDFDDGLRITQNKSIAIDLVTAAVALGGATINGYWEEPGT